MSQFGFVELTRRLEQRLVTDLGLCPRNLPTELARVDGMFRERPIRLEARAYSGPALHYARFVELSGDALEIGNILLFARPELALPVLGTDLVALGRGMAVVVADLSPVANDEGERREQLAVLQRHCAARAPLEETVELPAWAARLFSGGALCARIRRDRAADAAARIEGFVEAFLELVQRSAGAVLHEGRHASTSDDRSRGVLARYLQYNESHRREDRGLSLLRGMFPRDLADRLLCEVLFPERMPT